MGRSGRAMIQALIAETDPGKLAALAHPKVRAPQARLREALRGCLKRHHRFLLDLHLQQIDALDAGIAAIDREVDAGLASFRDAVKQLSTIPGVSELSAPGHPVGDRHRHEPVCHGCASALLGRPVPAQRPKPHGSSPWAEGPGQAPLDPPAHRCPLAEGHTRSMRLGRGAHQGHLPQRAVREVAHSTRAEKAVCAVAASILTAAYHMLKDGTFYQDLGATHFDRRRPDAQARRLIKRLADLGFSVQLKPAAAVS
jgi:transposase